MTTEKVKTAITEGLELGQRRGMWGWELLEICQYSVSWSLLIYFQGEEWTNILFLKFDSELNSKQMP